MKNPLRAFREALGLSRNQLAAAIGKSPQTLEKYEAEAPADLVESLAAYARRINRSDAISLLIPPDQPERAMSEVSKPMASHVSSTGTSGKSPRENVNSVTIQSAHQGEVRQIVVTPGECRWIIRFLNILHHGPVAARAIKWNLLMVLKGLGIPYDSQDHLLPNRTEKEDRAARREVEIVDALVREPEETPITHPAPRKGSGGAKG